MYLITLQNDLLLIKININAIIGYINPKILQFCAINILVALTSIYNKEPSANLTFFDAFKIVVEWQDFAIDWDYLAASGVDVVQAVSVVVNVLQGAGKIFGLGIDQEGVIEAREHVNAY
jgi:hypothetical protein